jgi:glycosyltransferase involved in cell wall biosynthesis
MAWLRFRKLIGHLKPQVLHGHGAKAGVFINLTPRGNNNIRVYTPHGGSLHFPPNTLAGAFYSRLERVLMDRIDLFLFESMFARDTFQRVIGKPAGLVQCVFNGVAAREFDPVPVAPEATDVVYVGEFRRIKGADLLVEAVAELRASGKAISLTLAGDGEETNAIKAQVERLSLARSVRFIGHVEARRGFAQGRLLVVPSRGDSMPYVVIEAAAAGIPMIAANVGGIPEIFGPHHDALFTPNSPSAIASAIAAAMTNSDAALERAKALRERIFQLFSQKSMVEGVIAGYREAFAKR